MVYGYPSFHKVIQIPMWNGVSLDIRKDKEMSRTKKVNLYTGIIIFFIGLFVVGIIWEPNLVIISLAAATVWFIRWGVGIWVDT